MVASEARSLYPQETDGRRSQQAFCVIAQNGRNWFWFTRRGGMQSLHRASPFAASSACSPGRIARCYWGRIMSCLPCRTCRPAALHQQFPFILLVGFGPKSVEVLQVTVQSWCETPGCFSSFLRFCASCQQNDANDCMKGATLYFLLLSKMRL